MKQRVLHRREFIKATTLSVLALARPWVSRAAEPAAIDRQALQKLAGTLHGRVITPSDSEYDAARQVWNAIGSS
jgi:hypothetical protein